MSYFRGVLTVPEDKKGPFRPDSDHKYSFVPTPRFTLENYDSASEHRKVCEKQLFWPYGIQVWYGAYNYKLFA